MIIRYKDTLEIKKFKSQLEFSKYFNFIADKVNGERASNFRKSKRFMFCNN